MSIAYAVAKSVIGYYIKRMQNAQPKYGLDRGKVDLRGKRFGRLFVKTYVKGGLWHCVCDCGGEATVLTRNLNNGNTRSCGCLQKSITAKMRTTHGMSNSTEYHIWRTMKARCSQPTDCNYPNYGGRGIKVCEQWQNSFEAFLADMGRRPAGLTLDRIDVNGDYEPGNCRWATTAEQNTNRRNNHKIEFGGRTLTVTQWARELGVKPGLIANRLRAGWSVHRALSQPRGGSRHD